MDLVEWTSHHIDSINAFKHDLVSKEIKGNEIFCKYKDKEMRFFVFENLCNIFDFFSDFLLNKINSKITIVCLNKRENLEILLKRWDDFIKIKELKVMFVNINVNMQWSIMPYVHNKVIERNALKKGLVSLFQSVPPL